MTTNMRSGRAEKVETNLVVQQEVFERAYSTLLNGLKHLDKKFLDSLSEAHTANEIQRVNELENLKKSLMAIAMVIQKLNHNIKNDQFVRDHDTEFFKEQLTSIEQNLRDFKCVISEQLQTLQEEEEDLQHSIDSLYQHMNETSTTKNQEGNSLTRAVTVKATARVSTKLNEKVHPDVQEFNQFLSNNGGHTGGWDTKDHLLFTRFLQRYKGLDQMTTALLDFMPDKTPEQIAQHESWYHDYLTLKDAQRRALRDWREEQTSQKQKKENKGCEINDPSPSHITAKRDPTVKEKIKKWKEQQEELRQLQLEELQEKRKQEEESWKKKVAYFELQRRTLEERRIRQQVPLVTRESPNLRREILIPKKHIPLKDFWEQDKLYIIKRQARLQRFSASPRTRSSSQSAVHAERDPARLLRPTAVWRAHIRRSLSEDGNRQPSVSLYIADVPHLAVPKWREGLV